MGGQVRRAGKKGKGGMEVISTKNTTGNAPTFLKIPTRCEIQIFVPT